jgi:hypothetical protein
MLYRHGAWRLARPRAGIGLCRQHRMDGGDGKQAERKKSASHDVVPFSMLRTAGE